MHEPPETAWRFPEVDDSDEQGLVAVGADLEPGTLLAAYRAGYFPMPLDRSDLIGWWSPDPRAVLELDDLVVSRSLRRSTRRYEVRVDTAFRDVMTACANPTREGGWIDDAIVEAYTRLHQLGWAHSVECWHEGELVGGLYGVSIGAFFAGESMFHRTTDASKVALVALCEILATVRSPLIDVQWSTPHLASLGVRDLARADYLVRLERATAAAGPSWRAP